MSEAVSRSLIQRRYQEVFGAAPTPSFATYMTAGHDRHCGAALGYRRADVTPLFLEHYLETSIETLVSEALGRDVARGEIVEIGNLAAENAMAMIALWGAAANDLGGSSEVAVATLTAPLRGMFARIGVPIIELAPALPERLGADAVEWGAYYSRDPRVCMGVIAQGQEAVSAFLRRRSIRKAA
jgi:Thermostable hemolysin